MDNSFNLRSVVLWACCLFGGNLVSAASCNADKYVFPSLSIESLMFTNFLAVSEHFFPLKARQRTHRMPRFAPPLLPLATPELPAFPAEQLLFVVRRLHVTALLALASLRSVRL